MSDEEIFNKLLDFGKKSKDPKGTVSACLVVDGKIVDIQNSSDDGIYHAEEQLLNNLEKDTNVDNYVLYTTLEPCSQRTDKNRLSCADLIVSSGIKNVVYSAPDPEQQKNTKDLFLKNKISYRQISNTEIIEKSKDLFVKNNSKLKEKFTIENI